MKIIGKLKIKRILAIAVLLSLVLPLTAYAEEASVSGQMSGVLGEVLQTFANLLSVTLQLLQRILWPIFLAIGGLLNNDILFGYGMEQRLLDVWVQIRNFVNIIFVVALLGVALFNVLAFKPDSEFALKTFLPKFAIALVAVNFSYIGMKIVLDVSNVMTYAVFALPSSISEQVATPDFMSCTGTGNARTCNVKQNDASKKTVEKICTAYYGNQNAFKKLGIEIDDLPKATKDEKALQEKLRNEILCKLDNNSAQYTLSDSGRKFFEKYNSRNMALIMAIQFMNVTKVDEVSTKMFKNEAVVGTDGKVVQDAKIDISGLTFQLLFAVVLYIIYGAAYLAIFVVLLTRLVALWLFIALSPVIVLKFVLPQGAMPESGGDIGQKFFKNTFAPVLMGIPLTIGYIILEAFKGGFNVKGQATSLSTIRIDNVAISDLQSMIIAFAAVAVVWVGVFAAARGTFAEFATEFIKQQVKGLGTKAVQGLKMIPLIPAGPGGKGQSFYQAQATMAKPWNALMAKYGPQATEGSKMDIAEIEKVTRNLGTTSEENVKTAIRSGLATPAGQEKVYKLLEKARTTPKHKDLAKRIRDKLGTEYKDLERGNLGTGPIKRIEDLVAAAPVVGAAPRTPAPGAAGAKGTGTTTQTQEGIDPNVKKVNEVDAELGIVSSGLLGKRDDWRNETDPVKKKQIEADIAKDAEMGNINKALGAKPEITAVKGRVEGGKIAADTKGGDEVKGLSGDLDKALKAMKAKGVGEADAKKMLGRVLKGKFGADTKAFVDANADVGKHVTIE